MNYLKEISNINKEGVEKYGWKWINYNELAINKLVDLGVDHQNRPNQLIITAVVLAVMDAINQGK